MSASDDARRLFSKIEDLEDTAERYDKLKTQAEALYSATLALIDAVEELNVESPSTDPLVRYDVTNAIREARTAANEIDV